MMLCSVFKAPEPTVQHPGQKSVFLGGSIDQGMATDWQAVLTAGLSDLPVAIFNPRRNSWDAALIQDASNPVFREQVEWELDHLEQADVIVFCFDPGGKAPVTLLELGLFARSGKAIVYCPNGYWRRGNVHITCSRYNVPMMDSMDGLIAEVRRRLS